MEKIQVTAFCIQEFIISGLYLYETQRILKPSASFQKKRTRQVMLHLIYVNFLIILMDITLLCTEYADLYEIQITFKGALYSVKLRLEFAVLNQLMSLTSHHNSSDDGPNGPYSHSATRGVGLATFNDHHAGPGDGAAAEAANATYTVFASRSGRSPFAEAMEDNCVMKTTDVTVKTEQIKPDLEEKGSEETVGTAVATPANAHRPRPARSATSSEVEFAAAGY